MKKGGPKPKPNNLKQLDGNPGKRRIILHYPDPPGDMPEAPAHLDTYAREEWDRIAEGLNVMGILRNVDQNTLAAYCTSYSRWRLAEEELNKLKIESPLKGLIMKTQKNNIIQQPLIGIANKAAADMMRYASEFGLTPSARAALNIDRSAGGKGKFAGLIGGATW